MSCPSPGPGTHLRSRSHGRLLVLAAIFGVPISAAVYGFLALLLSLQQWMFTDLPMGLGSDGIPLPGVVAALASLSLGVALGPEAPLFALGGVLAGCAVRLARRPTPPQTTAVVAATGSR